LESEIQDYDFTIAKRTFHRDRKDILSLFDVDIQYNRTTKFYFIAEGENQK